MGHAPSLRRLFSRSSHLPSVEVGKTQFELFSVSVLAFGLQFDSSFRDHFLSQCYASKVPLPTDGVQITIQDGAEADLSIRDTQNGIFIVIEAKVGAPLKKHQDPADEAFFGESGYGTKNLPRMEEPGISRIIYCTLTREKRVACPSKEGIEFGALTWSDLQPAVGFVPGPLWKDLLLTFGSIFDPALLFFEMRNKQNITKIGQAVDIYATLVAFAAHYLGIKNPRLDVSVSDDSNCSNFGIQLSKNSGRLKGYRSGDFSHPSPTAPVGWIGYEQRPLPFLTVWAYCADKKCAETLKRQLEQAGLGKVELEDDNVGILASSDDLEKISDVEWFQKAIDAVFELDFA